MSVKEVAIACSVNPNTPSLSSILPSISGKSFEHEIALCGPLIKIKEAGSSGGENEVQLFHRSAKEFLTSPRAHSTRLWSKAISWDPDEAKLQFILTCMTYVSLEDVETMGDPGFLDFASKYWVDAYREDDNTAELWDHFHTLGLSGRLDLAFRYNDRRFQKTTTCKSDKWIDRLIKAGNRDADVLFLAIYFGIRGFVEKGIEKLEPENDGPRFTERNPSLVKTAASLGHIDSVVLLLKHFSNPEKGFKGAFRAASSRSRYDMI